MRWLPLLLLPAALVAQHHGHNPDPNHPRSAQEWIEALENPKRDAWQKPDAVLEALALGEGERIADIGAGSGYFSLRFAEAVGSAGVVYATDINDGLVEHLGKLARDRELPQLKPVLSAPTDPHLDAASVDTIFICDVVHHIDNRARYYPHLVRALKPGGRLVIVDFYKRDAPVGPETVWKLSKAEVTKEALRAGFRLEREHDFLPHQYFLEFRLPE